MHVAVGDPFAPEQTVARWEREAAARGIEASVHRYPDVGHFFTDRSLTDYDAAVTRSVIARARTFLRGLE
jgi:dienelactone hydrolase